MGTLARYELQVMLSAFKDNLLGKIVWTDVFRIVNYRWHQQTLQQPHLISQIPFSHFQSFQPVTRLQCQGHLVSKNEMAPFLSWLLITYKYFYFLIAFGASPVGMNSSKSTDYNTNASNRNNGVSIASHHAGLGSTSTNAGQVVSGSSQQPFGGYPSNFTPTTTQRLGEGTGIAR